MSKLKVPEPSDYKREIDDFLNGRMFLFQDPPSGEGSHDMSGVLYDLLALLKAHAVQIDKRVEAGESEGAVVALPGVRYSTDMFARWSSISQYFKFAEMMHDRFKDSQFQNHRAHIFWDTENIRIPDGMHAQQFWEKIRAWFEVKRFATKSRQHVSAFFRQATTKLIDAEVERMHNLNITMVSCSNRKQGKEIVDGEICQAVERTVDIAVEGHLEEATCIVIVSSDQGFNTAAKYATERGVPFYFLHNAFPKSDHECTLKHFATEVVYLPEILSVACDVCLKIPCLCVACERCKKVKPVAVELAVELGAAGLRYLCASCPLCVKCHREPCRCVPIPCPMCGGESPCRARCVVLIPAGTNVTVVGWVPSKGKGNMCIPFGGNEYRVVILFKSFARDIPRRSDINGMKCVTSVDIVVVENRQGVSYRPDVDGPRGRVLL